MLSKSLALTLFACCGLSYCQTAPNQTEVQAHMARAQQYLQQRKPDLALPEFEAVLALDPGNLDAQANEGVLLYFSNQYALAFPHLQAALKLNPELWKLQALLGLAEFHLGKTQDARADLTSALPHLANQKIQDEAGAALIGSYSKTGELEKAASTVSVLLEAQPTNTKLLLESYTLYSQLANNAMLTLALTAPDSAEMHQVMARELQQHGDEAAAIANYRQAIQLDPKLPGLYYEYGVLLYNSNDEKLQAEAQSQFQAAVEVNPRDEKSQLMLGEVAARRGDMKAAAAADARAVELQPDDADACTEYAKILMNLNDKAQARKLLEHAIELDPSNYTAHYRLSTLDRQQGRPEDAKRQLADYQKYKAMQAKLESVFHSMKVQVKNKPEDADAKSR